METNHAPRNHRVHIDESYRESMTMKPTPNKKKPNLLNLLAKNYSGPISHVALSALSAWMIVTGLKGLAGFTVNSHTALADLLGIVIVIAIVRWMKVGYKAK